MPYFIFIVSQHRTRKGPGKSYLDNILTPIFTINIIFSDDWLLRFIILKHFVDHAEMFVE